MSSSCYFSKSVWKCPVCGETFCCEVFVDPDLPDDVIIAENEVRYNKFLWKVIDHLAQHIKKLKENVK
ncbi:hypothetical protein DRP04_12425 [Archaeoglobales archaeon]|nr:MAG: hypothetical protein DRP04_12425 [Archaeoglobales archaeon]